MRRRGKDRGKRGWRSWLSHAVTAVIAAAAAVGLTLALSSGSSSGKPAITLPTTTQMWAFENGASAVVHTQGNTATVKFTGPGVNSVAIVLGGEPALLVDTDESNLTCGVSIDGQPAAVQEIGKADTQWKFTGVTAVHQGKCAEIDFNALIGGRAA